MKKYPKITILLLCLSVVFTYSVSCYASSQEAPKEYILWLENLKQEMVQRGISKNTVRKVYKDNNFYHANPEVVKIDRKQIEFALTSTEYLNRVVNKNRVQKAQQKYQELYPLFKDMETKYGVPFNYIVAFWAVETNFGQNFGGYDVIDALTTLSYDKRRPQFFKEELYQALKIIDNWHIDHNQMQGSWAGAMGHFQFMPSTFNNYAVDYDGDNQINIWSSFEDASASASNYLSSLGWKKELPWGLSVSLPWNFDYSVTGRQNIKTIQEWQKLGIKTADNKKIMLDADVKASLVLPEGKKGAVYLVTDNFKKIMLWNRSENYALAIGTLADYIKSGKTWSEQNQNPAVRLKTEDIVKIQSFINKLGWGTLDEDGQLGSKTREAIKGVQAKAKLTQDGYPDYQLLQKINRYNSSIGFAVPMQPRKLHKPR